MASVIRDLRYALRSLSKARGFTLVAVLTLALGMGATTTIFSVVNGVLLRPLPYQEPERLMFMGHKYARIHLEAGVSGIGFRFYRDQNRVFSSTAAISEWEANYADQGEPVRLIGARVSADYFRTVGMALIAGRGFTADEEQLEADRVVVLSEGLWRRGFGADPRVIGRDLQINGQGHRVVGIVQEGLGLGVRQHPEIWKPLAMTEREVGCWGCEWLGMVARLKPGVTLADAAADADRMTKLVVQEQGPEFARADWSLWVKPANEMIVGDVRPALLMLLGAVGFVLLIACANLANLLLVRGTTRRREMAVRTALGAGRWRITREILAECLVLSVLGAAGGLGLAAAAVRSLVAWGPERLPRLSGITIDAHVLMFTGAVAVLTTLLFGLAPAVQAARGSLQGVIKAGGRGAAGGDGRRRARFGLVVSEIALSMILLAGAGLMIKSFRRLIAVDPGFRADSVLTMRTSLPAAKYTTPEAIADFYDRARIAIKAIPGVKVAGAGVVLPMEGGGWTQSFQIEGYQPPSGGASPWGDFRVVTPGYFEALGIVLRRGRGFEETDMASGRPVAVVDEVLAQQYWPGQDPIGKRVGFGGPDGVVWRDVVGVVAHILQNGPKDDRRTQLYVPLSQFPVATMGFAIRTTGSPAAQVSAVRKAIQSVDPIQPIFAAQPMVVLASEANAQPRFMAFLLGSFAVLAAVLAAVGIYGVMSYTVAQDTREIGIRLALGAREERVLGAVLRRGVGLAVGGVLVGMGGTLALGKLLASQLFEVSPADPIILVSVGTVLIGVALGASFFPARRAMAVDPIVALRNE